MAESDHLIIQKEVPRYKPSARLLRVKKGIRNDQAGEFLWELVVKVDGVQKLADLLDCHRSNLQVLMRQQGRSVRDGLLQKLAEVSGKSVEEVQHIFGMGSSSRKNKDEQASPGPSFKRRPWTSKEDVYLRTYFPSRDKSVAAISAVLRRTTSSIKQQGIKLGLVRPDRRLGRWVRCSCGCRRLVYVRNDHEYLKHHFVDMEHHDRFLVSQQVNWYPDDAPSGSKKREILDALRRVIIERGLRAVVKKTGISKGSLRKYERGTWCRLRPLTVERLRKVIVIDTSDPQVQDLIDTEETMKKRGTAVHEFREARWKNPRLRKRGLASKRAKTIGVPNPKNSKNKRDEWARKKADPDLFAQEVAKIRLITRRRKFLPSEQIRRSWIRWAGHKCQGRTPTDQDAMECARFQASDLELSVEVVLLVIDRERGTLFRPGPLPDLDLLCAVRDIQREHPGCRWVTTADLVNTKLGRQMDADAIERTFRRLKCYLHPRKYAPRGGLPWTVEEDEHLRAHPDRTDAELGRDLGRSATGIAQRRLFIGLRKGPPSGKRPRPRPWTGQEDTLLRTRYPSSDYTLAEIAQAVMRTESATIQRARFLDLRRRGPTAGKTHGEAQKSGKDTQVGAPV